MAEGLLRSISKGSVEVASAGTHPSFVHPIAIEVLKEIGVDISGHTSKSVDLFITEHVDVVITVCDSAKERCPYFPGAKRTLHIPFEDPVGFRGTEQERLQKFREVRDQITTRMEQFYREELS
jgi:arsenate reductase